MQPRPYLPGFFTIEPGARHDYFALHRFHYCTKPPATWAAIRIMRYHPPDAPIRLAGVGVLSWPTPCNVGRQTYFATRDSPFGQRLRWINRHLRTISRIIIHPQFRGIGLAVDLVRHLLSTNPTRFIEATAKMAAIHPFFQHAGMIRVPLLNDQSAYFIFDQLKGGDHDLYANRPDRPVATVFHAGNVAPMAGLSPESAPARVQRLPGSSITDAIPAQILL